MKRYLLLVLITLMHSYLVHGGVHYFGNPVKYDQNINTFSPDGELNQVEYAGVASDKGDTVLVMLCDSYDGIKGVGDAKEESIVICLPASERNILVDRKFVDKVNKIDENVWMIYSGLSGDGRALVRLARKIIAQYRTKFGTSPSIAYLANVIGDIQHDFTLFANERPYGVSICLVGYSGASAQPEIYMSRPSGLISAWNSVVLGKNSGKALEYLDSSALYSYNYDSDHNAVPVLPSKSQALQTAFDVMNLPEVMGISELSEREKEDLFGEKYDKKEEKEQEEQQEERFSLRRKLDILVIQRGKDGAAASVKTIEGALNPPL